MEAINSLAGTSLKTWMFLYCCAAVRTGCCAGARNAAVRVRHAKTMRLRKFVVDIRIPVYNQRWEDNE